MLKLLYTASHLLSQITHLLTLLVRLNQLLCDRANNTAGGCRFRNKKKLYTCICRWNLKKIKIHIVPYTVKEAKCMNLCQQSSQGAFVSIWYHGIPLKNKPTAGGGGSFSPGLHNWRVSETSCSASEWPFKDYSSDANWLLDDKLFFF